MSADKRTLSRKPLSDCTNTVVDSSSLLSSSCSKHQTSSIQLSKPSDHKNQHNVSQPVRGTVCSPNILHPSASPSHPFHNLSNPGGVRNKTFALTCKEKTTTVNIENKGKVVDESVASIRNEDPCTSGSQAGYSHATECKRKYEVPGTVDKRKTLKNISSDQHGTDTLQDPCTPNSRSGSSINAGPFDWVTTTCYTRGCPSGKRKDVEKSVGSPFLHTSRETIRRQSSKEVRAFGLSKSCSIPRHKHKKKPRECRGILSKDFIEKQRAYFAEVDAFELVEEAVSDGELE